VASPAFRTGHRSFYVPERLREGYVLALNDPDILSLRREIAQHRATADHLRRRLDEADSGGVGLQTAWRDFKTAYRTGNAQRLASVLSRLDAAMSSHAVDDAIRKELRLETELLSKLTRAENDRLEQLHQMITREQALAYMRRLAVAVKEEAEAYVGDTHVRTLFLRAISAKFEQLADRRGPEDVGARGQPPDLVGTATDHG